MSKKDERRGSFVVRSRRAGAPSLAKKDSDRAAWYSSLEEEIFKKLHDERLIEESKELERLIITESDDVDGMTSRHTTAQSTVSMTEEEIEALKEQEKKEHEEQMKRQKEALMKKIHEDNAKKKKTFSGGLTMQLADESDKKRKEDEERRNAVGRIKRPDPEFYERPKDFDAKKWIVKLTNDEDVDKYSTQIKSRLLVLPWLCGDHSVYKGFAKELIKYGVEVYSITMPGRYIRYKEKNLVSIFQMCHNIMTALDELHMIRIDLPPLILYGHDVGGIVGFELTLLLQKDFGNIVPEPVKHLIVSGCNAPHIVTKLNSDRFETKYFCASGGELHTRLVKLNIIPVFLRDRKDIMNLYLKCARSDYEMLEKYIYWQENPDEKEKRGSRLGGGMNNVYVSPALSCPVTVMIAKDDPMVDKYTAIEWLRHCIADEVRSEFKPNVDDDESDEDSVSASSVGSGTKPRKKHAWEKPIPNANKYYKVFETGGHMFIRDTIKKTFNKQFINLITDICSHTTAFARAKSR